MKIQAVWTILRKGFEKHLKKNSHLAKFHFCSLTNPQTRNVCSAYFTVIKARGLQLDSTAFYKFEGSIHKLFSVNYGLFIQVLYFHNAVFI